MHDEIWISLLQWVRMRMGFVRKAADFYKHSDWEQNACTPSRWWPCRVTLLPVKCKYLIGIKKKTQIQNQLPFRVQRHRNCPGSSKDMWWYYSLPGLPDGGPVVPGGAQTGLGFERLLLLAHHLTEGRQVQRHCSSVLSETKDSFIYLNTQQSYYCFSFPLRHWHELRF